MKYGHRPIMNRLRHRFENLYGEQLAQKSMERLDAMYGRYGVGDEDFNGELYWDQADSILITYGDMIQSGTKPLKALKHFADIHIKGAISTIHVLPFFPYSSDDGFSIIDYREVNPELGTWNDIHDLSENFSLMFDLVLNHCSRRNAWFEDYVAGVAPGRHYFIEMDPDADVSAVVRPRSTPLLTRAQTRHGARHVWTTFSEDQVDLDFANPDVLFEFLDILFFYISRGCSIIRLDAIAYLWKQFGTPCIHHEKTHEVVRIIRDVLNLVAPHVAILTETNVPHEENISYFGQGDEAHIVYQFSLPPLLMHTLISGNASYLTAWAAQLDPPPEGCTYLNFTASHDGIGMRPLEGILQPDEIERLLKHVKARGGHISSKQNSDGTQSPYELNITYLDALTLSDGEPEWMSFDRFICSQTMALSLKGMPAIYFNSLVGARNDHEAVKQTGRARSINRHKWDEAELYERLNDSESENSKVLWEYSRILHLRATHPAFHPDGYQRILDYGPAFFALERIAPDNGEVILCISNITAQPRKIIPSQQTGALTGDKRARDLIRGEIDLHENASITLAPYQTCWLVLE
jgi:sucrose phosphorylase